MTPHTYRQNGCNRGGTEHASQLVGKLPQRSVSSLAVELVDPEHGRAAALAPILEARGVPVTVRQVPAPLRSPVTVDVYAVDDVGIPARALEAPIRTPLLEVALLVSVPTIEEVGGVVLAIAASVTPDAAAVQDAARVLLSRIAALAPGRHSSARMAAHGVHTIQMPGARHAAHDRLTTQSAAFLTTGQVEPELAVVDGFTRRSYRVRAVEARRETRRRVLKQAALQEILPQVSADSEAGGVAFYELRDPWLYLVLARRTASRWRLDRAIELPVMMPGPRQAPVQVPTFVTD